MEEGKAKRGQKKKTEGRRVDEKNVGETMEEKRKRSEITMRKKYGRKKKEKKVDKRMGKKKKSRKKERERKKRKRGGKSDIKRMTSTFVGAGPC